MGRNQSAEEYVSQTELAKRLGISPPAVTKLKKAGKIAMGPGGKVAYRATMQRLGDTLDQHRPQKSLKAVKAAQNDGNTEDPAESGAKHITLAEAQRLRAVAVAGIAEMERAEKAGALIDKAGAEKLIFEFVRGLRDAIENFPVRYAAQIGAELGVPAAKVNAALSKRLKDYLGELADRQLRL